MRGGSASALRAAYQRARSRVSELALVNNHIAAHEGGHVAVGALNQPSCASREIFDALRIMQSKVLEVDEIEVGAATGHDHTAIAERIEIGGVLGEAPDRVLEREAR